MSVARCGPARLAGLVLPVALLLASSVLSADTGQQDATNGGDDFDDECEFEFAGRSAEAADANCNSEEDEENEAPEPAAQGRRKRSRRPRYCAVQMEFNRACRRAFDAGGTARNDLLDKGWVVPYKVPSFRPAASGTRQNAIAYWIKPWGGS